MIKGVQSRAANEENEFIQPGAVKLVLRRHCRMHAAAQCTCAAIVTDGQGSNFTVPGCTPFVDQSFVSGHIRHLSTVPAYAQALLCRCF